MSNPIKSDLVTWQGFHDILWTSPKLDRDRNKKMVVCVLARVWSNTQRGYTPANTTQIDRERIFRFEWNKAHCEPSVNGNDWFVHVSQMSNVQIIDAMREVGEMLAHGWIAAHDGELVLDLFNLDLARRLDQAEKIQKARGKRRKRDTAETIPAPVITNAEAIDNLSKGKRD